MWGSKNENCLAGMACPSCGSEGPFSIVSTCIAEWTDDGTEEASDLEFDDDSHCRCMACDFCEVVDKFRKPQMPGALLVVLADKEEFADVEGKHPEEH